MLSKPLFMNSVLRNKIQQPHYCGTITKRVFKIIIKGKNNDLDIYLYISVSCTYNIEMYFVCN